MSGTSSRLRVRRLALAVPSVTLAVAIAALAAVMLARIPRSGLDWALYGLFVVLMAWESFVVWQLVLGFVAWLRGPGALSALERRAAALEAVATGKSRTAVVVPICDEDPAAVFANVRVIARSLARTGETGDVDIHVLSDSRDPAVAAQEIRAYESCLALAGEPGRLPRMHYRHRAENQGRKAGNVAEFMARCGDDYECMIVLDADSLMSGATMRRLIRLMEENPGVGLIQTISYAVNRQTLFARIQQFAVRLYAPLALRGLEYWQGPDGTYWGHNAIVRIAPFRAHCGLPVLPGRPPLGGEILCHDTVESALLRRAGWEVRLLPELDGTWEEMPTNTIDLMGRERRWCQGNLQHMRCLGWPGLRPASRVHLALGVMGYLTAPLWWTFLLLGTLRAASVGESQDLGVLAYGLTEPGAAAGALFAIAAMLILLPRVLNVVRALGELRGRRSFGEVRGFLASVALEQVLWTLLGPVLALKNAGFVLSTFLGRVVPWDAQPRADRQVSWPEALRVHAVACGLGAVMATIAFLVGGWFMVWILPTAIGLVASPAMTVLLSRTDLGRLSQRLGLFLTVDDTAPARELLELRTAAAAGPVLPAAPAAAGAGARA